MRRVVSAPCVVAGCVVGLMAFTAGPGRIAERAPGAAAPDQRPAVTLRIERTAERLARGRYLVEGVVHCFACHSQVDWKRTGLPRRGTEGGGGHMPDDLIPFKVYAPNISPDGETGAGTWSDEQFVRALRQGIGHDGRALSTVMPYLAFRSMSDEDLAAVIAYVRSIRPVHNKVPQTVWPEDWKQHYKPLPPAGPVPPPEMSNPVKRGEYLVTIANCAGCHTPVDERLQPLPGMDFAGGGLPFHGPWGKVSSQNLTPDPSGIPHYDEAMFIKTIRAGRVGGVRPLNHEMPWEYFRKMTDDDLKAIFAYLRTLKPVQHRVDNTEPPTPCRRCGFAHGFGDRN